MPIKAFLKRIYETSPNKMRANWEIGNIFKVGEIGKIENGVFVRYSSLEEKGVPLGILSGPRKAGKMDLSSEKGVKISPLFKAQGNAQMIELNGEVAFEIEFEKANSFVFRADGIQSSRIRNMETVEREVLRLHEEGKWNKDYVIISDIIEAHSLTLLLAGEAGVKTTLSATGKFTPGQLDIADASVGFIVLSTNKLAVEIVGKKDTTPLFKVRGIRRPFLIGDPKLVSKGSGTSLEPEFRLVEIPPY